MIKLFKYFPIFCVVLVACNSAEDAGEPKEQSSGKQEEAIDLSGQWVHVRTEINYDHIIHSEPKNTPFFIFENDSLWYGYYPFYTYYSLRYSQKGDTIIDDLGKPMFIIKMKNDTLIMRDLDARMISRDYWVRKDFDQSIIRDLKYEDVSWQSHQFLWEFDETELLDEDECDFRGEFSLDLRPENADNYFFEGDNLHYIMGKDTVSFSHISSDSTKLETLHICENFLVLHWFDFKRTP